jgi:hypothetical protein
MRGWIYRRIDTISDISRMQSESGTIYEKELGPNTTKLAEAKTAYDPDSTWHETE